MDETNGSSGFSDERLREEAEKRFNEGLLIFNQTYDREGLDRVIELWLSAFDMYSTLGDKAKTKETGRHLAKLYKKRFHCAPGSADEYRDGPLLDFKHWDIFFKIGCFGFGGPMGVFGLLQEELVNKRNILTNEAFLEGAVLGDILPGPVTMDIVTYTGYKIHKWKGAILSTLLFLIPSFALMIAITILYETYGSMPKLVKMFHFLGGAVCALIISVGLRLGEKEIKDYNSMAIFIWAIISSMIFKMDIFMIVLLGGLSGILLYVVPTLTKRPGNYTLNGNVKKNEQGESV